MRFLLLLALVGLVAGCATSTPPIDPVDSTDPWGNSITAESNIGDSENLDPFVSELPSASPEYKPEPTYAKEGIAQGATAEEFNCTKDRYSSEVLVKAFVDKESGKASIHAAGETHEAVYYVQGFDRRWEFGLDDPIEVLYPSGEKAMRLPYLFIIRPNGVSSYYDFSQTKNSDDTVPPSMVFDCSEIKNS